MVKIFIGNLSGSSVTEDDLRKTFEQVGPVTETVVMQRGGFGFVHMENKDDANRAVSTLNGTDLGGTTLSVEVSHGKKGGRGQEDVKIFVGNINKEKVTSRDLEDAFSKYGTVTEAVVVEKYGFVHMTSRDDAKIAINRLNRTDINGCSIDVQFSTGENRRGGGGGGGAGAGGPGGRRGEPDRRGGRGSRDPYYDDYYYPPPRRGDPYDRRPPPPDPYYRGRFDPREDMYARRPPRGDPYYDYYPPPPRDPREPYGYPPRDPYGGYDREYERDLPPRREFRDEPAASRSRYPPPPPIRREQADPYDDHYGRSSAAAGPEPYGARTEYGSASSADPYAKRSADPYASGAAPRRSAGGGGMKAENFAEDSYSAVSRSATGASGLYTSMSGGEYPGEKRPVPGSSSAYGGPPPKRTYSGGVQGGSSYAY